MAVRAFVFALLLTLASVAQDAKPDGVSFHLVADCEAKTSYKISLDGASGTLCLDRHAVATSSDIAEARLQRDSQDKTEVAISLTDNGAKAMLETTQHNIGNRMAVVMDGRVISVFTIRSAVSRGFNITGRFTPQQTSDLMAALTPPSRR